MNAFIKTLKSKKVKEIINIGYGRSIMLKKIMKCRAKTNFFLPNYGKIELRKEENLDIYEYKKQKKF